MRRRRAAVAQRRTHRGLRGITKAIARWPIVSNGPAEHAAPRAVHEPPSGKMLGTCGPVLSDQSTCTKEAWFSCGKSVGVQLGNDLTSAWDAVVSGRSGIGPIQEFDASAFTTRFGGSIRDFGTSGLASQTRWWRIPRISFP